MICTISNIIFGGTNPGAWDGRANSTNGGKENCDEVFRHANAKKRGHL